MAENHHEHGKMDITAQEKTYEGFVKMTVRATVVIIVALILLALINA